MSYSAPAVTLSVRVSPEVRNQLEQLSDCTGRTKSFLAAEAIENYVALHAWQIQAIEKAVTKANSKKAKWVDHKKVSEWVESWDSQGEKAAPK